MKSFTAGMHSYDAIKDLKPRMVEKFLALTGWNKEEERADVSQLWINHERNAQIFLPLDDTYRDFGARFSEALRGISIIHQLRGEALGLEIMSAGSDILLLRADQATVDGTIPPPRRRDSSMALRSSSLQRHAPRSTPELPLKAGGPIGSMILSKIA